MSFNGDEVIRKMREGVRRLHPDTPCRDCGESNWVDHGQCDHGPRSRDWKDALASIRFLAPDDPKIRADVKLLWDYIEELEGKLNRT